jgi:hypothetical protein
VEVRGDVPDVRRERALDKVMDWSQEEGTMKKFRFTSMVAILAVTLALTIVFWGGCGKEGNLNAPTAPGGSDPLELSATNPQIQAVMAIQDRYTDELMADPEIVGTATGIDPAGDPCVYVFVTSDGVAHSVPPDLEGVPVVVRVTGKIGALTYAGPMTETEALADRDHQVRQTPPIQLGTSGGWRYDTSSSGCCSGTLGCLIQKNGIKYILSNYHVLYQDTVRGWNNRVATPGDPVIQPGLGDVNCIAGASQNIGTLVAGGGSLPNGNVDAGIAQVTAGMVRTDGSILEIGTISRTPANTTVMLPVKKSGRSTGLTRSYVLALNGTVVVNYATECGGGFAFQKRFTNQIVISNSGCAFCGLGDSGSLVVQDASTNPRPVGLLFAGSTTCTSSSTAFASPILSVLSYYGATIVGI